MLTESVDRVLRFFVTNETFDFFFLLILLLDGLQLELLLPLLVLKPLLLKLVAGLVLGPVMDEDAGVAVGAVAGLGEVLAAFGV